MVVDTSVLLAIFFAENHSRWAAAQLNAHAEQLCISTVNLTETLIRLQDRQPDHYHQAEQLLLAGGIRFVPPDTWQVRIAADARLRYPLNLGDCYAYALAVVEDYPILTLDSDFNVTDRPIIYPEK